MVRPSMWTPGSPAGRSRTQPFAAYVAEFYDQGRAPASAATAVAARRASGPASPASPIRPGSGRPGFWPATGGPPAIAAAARRGRSGPRTSPPSLATYHRPRRRGRGVESDPVARERGRLDAVTAGLLFMAGMRRSEVSALHWADVADAADGDGVLVTVRRSKTNQEGETTDVRFVKGSVAYLDRWERRWADTRMHGTTKRQVAAMFAVLWISNRRDDIVKTRPRRVGDPDRKGKVEAAVGHAQKTPLRGLRFEHLADGPPRRGLAQPEHPPARSRPSGPRRARGRRTASYRSRRRWWGCGSRRRPGLAGVAQRDRPLGPRRAGI